MAGAVPVDLDALTRLTQQANSKADMVKEKGRSDNSFVAPTSATADSYLALCRRILRALFEGN